MGASLGRWRSSPLTVSRNSPSVLRLTGGRRSLLEVRHGSRYPPRESLGIAARGLLGLPLLRTHRSARAAPGCGLLRVNPARDGVGADVRLPRSCTAGCRCGAATGRSLVGLQQLVLVACAVAVTAMIDRVAVAPRDRSRVAAHGGGRRRQRCRLASPSAASMVLGARHGGVRPRWCRGAVTQRRRPRPIERRVHRWTRPGGSTIGQFRQHSPWLWCSSQPWPLPTRLDGSYRRGLSASVPCGWASCPGAIPTWRQAWAVHGR